MIGLHLPFRAVLFALVLSPLTLVAQDSTDYVSNSTDIRFSPEGAFPLHWEIIDPEFVESDAPVPLVYGTPDTASFPFPFQLTSTDAELTDFVNSAVYAVEQSQLDDGTTAYTFTSPVHESGLLFIKQFKMHDRFLMTVQITVKNTRSDSAIDLPASTLRIGAGLGTIPGSIGGLGDSMYSYVDAVGFRDGKFSVLDVEEVDEAFDWLGIHNRYYLIAISSESGEPISGRASIPAEALTQSGIGETKLEFFPTIEVNLGLPENLDGGAEYSASYSIYAGPKDPGTLAASNQPLDSVMYYNLPNWMRWLTFKLGALLNAINGVVHSWWISLLVLVFIVRILLFPMAQKAIKMNAQMMADQAKLKPLIDAIKEKHKDPTLQYQKTMALYKEHGINPMAPMLGCVPVILQLPILIAIFNLLGQEVKMQGATFLWVKDLAIPDQLFALPFTLPYFGGYFNLLPVLMSVTMVLTTNMGTPAEGAQKKSQMRSMSILAFVFFALFYSFPAGLVFYWMMSNIGQYAQQEIMTRMIKRN